MSVRSSNRPAAVRSRPSVRGMVQFLESLHPKLVRTESSPLFGGRGRGGGGSTSSAGSDGMSNNGSTDGMFLAEGDPATGISLRAATLHSLVSKCIESFDLGGLRSPEQAALPQLVFQMHKWFASSDVLAKAFVSRYHNHAQKCRPGCPHTVSELPACNVYRHRMRICYALRFWIRSFPLQFATDHRLCCLLQEFGSSLQSAGAHELADLVDVSKIPSYDWMRMMSVRNPGGMKPSRKVSLVFNHLEPDELAEHLTFLDFKVIRRISFQEYRNYTVMGSMRESPRLERSIALFNGLSQWTQCMVLSRSTPQQRADVITKFVYVAKKLRELQNFNSLMAVVGGLSHSALARLSRTTACISPETQKQLGDLSDLLSSAANFSNYRKALQEAKGFHIPILGVHLKDLIQMHVALPDSVNGDPELINIRKVAQLSLVFQQLLSLQNASLPIDVNMDLVNTLRLSLDIAYTEDDIYELSLAREPRNSSSPQASPTRPPVFAEWVSGVCSRPDPGTIEKHVSAMVEAVFKTYDTDRDGYISQLEFQSVAGNFPFIDSFCVLDADQDGMISKSEMQSYFLRANFSHALRGSFRHQFQETTYFKPTFCSHCTGLLWGLVKQGYKCKDCGINAHKHCKDLAVLECRKRDPNSQDIFGMGAKPGRLKRRVGRAKLNSGSDGESPPSPVPKSHHNSCPQCHHRKTSSSNTLSVEESAQCPRVRKNSLSKLMTELFNEVRKPSLSNECRCTCNQGRPAAASTKPIPVIQVPERTDLNPGSHSYPGSSTGHPLVPHSCNHGNHSDSVDSLDSDPDPKHDQELEH